MGFVFYIGVTQFWEIVISFTHLEEVWSLRFEVAIAVYLPLSR